MVIEIYMTKYSVLRSTTSIRTDYCRWPVLTDSPSTWSAVPRGHINKLLTALVWLLVWVVLRYWPFSAQSHCIWAENRIIIHVLFLPARPISWFIHGPMWNSTRPIPNGNIKTSMFAQVQQLWWKIQQGITFLHFWYGKVPSITAVNLIACAISVCTFV